SPIQLALQAPYSDYSGHNNHFSRKDSQCSYSRFSSREGYSSLSRPSQQSMMGRGCYECGRLEAKASDDTKFVTTRARIRDRDTGPRTTNGSKLTYGTYIT
ncbi:hypothetical protein HAX54_033367, partial [Datura stramonium]|nr:hypothetical protein [Datura stramonium]